MMGSGEGFAGRGLRLRHKRVTGPLAKSPAKDTERGYTLLECDEIGLQTARRARAAPAAMSLVGSDLEPRPSRASPSAEQQTKPDRMRHARPPPIIVKERPKSLLPDRLLGVVLEFEIQRLAEQPLQVAVSILASRQIASGKDGFASARAPLAPARAPRASPPRAS